MMNRKTFIRVKRNPALPKCDNCRVKVAVNEVFRHHSEDGQYRYHRTSKLCRECTNEEINEESAFLNRVETSELIRS